MEAFLGSNLDRGWISRMCRIRCQSCLSLASVLCWRNQRLKPLRHWPHQKYQVFCLFLPCIIEAKVAHSTPILPILFGEVHRKTEKWTPSWRVCAKQWHGQIWSLWRVEEICPVSHTNFFFVSVGIHWSLKRSLLVALGFHTLDSEIFKKHLTLKGVWNQIMRSSSDGKVALVYYSTALICLWLSSWILYLLFLQLISCHACLVNDPRQPILCSILASCVSWASIHILCGHIRHLAYGRNSSNTRTLFTTMRMVRNQLVYSWISSGDICYSQFN